MGSFSYSASRAKQHMLSAIYWERLSGSDFTVSALRDVTGKPCTRFAHTETFSPNFRQKIFLKYKLEE